MAGVLAQLEAMEALDLIARVAELDPVMERLLADVAARHPSVRRIDGLGLHWTIELHGGDWHEWFGASDGPTPAALVQQRALDAGVLISTSGEETSLFLAPPLIATEEQVAQIVDGLDAGLDEADRLLAAAA
jgi:4-aminobutyrate aminotransferase-like enzyme